MTNTYKNIFSDLSKRGFMTPTYLSALIMQAMLPGQDERFVDKRDGLMNHGQVMTRGGNTFTSFSIDGIETFEVKDNAGVNQDYQINFCGNAQDAYDTAYWGALDKQSKNMIFWNYPNVGGSAGSVDSVHDLIDAGYLQVKRLLDQKIPAEKITLHGLSLGGGVAAQVARRLHEEGHFVHLEIDRSFSKVAPVVPEILKASGLNGPLSTSVIALSVSGLALGVVTAGLVASVGLVLASLAPKAIAPYIDSAFNIIGSVVGASIAIAGLLVGAVIGLALGTLLSLQSLWTDKPATLPMAPAFSAVLNAACCEMDSVDAIQQMIAKNNTHESTISVTNTHDDNVIHVAASLNVGLGFEPGMAQRDDENRALKQNINSIWYKHGGHNGTPSDRMEQMEPNGIPCPN